MGSDVTGITDELPSTLLPASRRSSRAESSILKTGRSLREPPGLRLSILASTPARAARYWGLSQQDYARADVWPLAPKGEILAIIHG